MQRLAHWLLSFSLALVATSAMAEFHTFQIEQMFSSADGTIQFVVLQETAGLNGENFLMGHTFTSTTGMTTQTYTFNVDLPGGAPGYYGPMPSPTAHAHVLIATQGFANLGLITPDYVIPNGFLPLANGTLNYAGVDQVSYAALPTDGVSALNRAGMTISDLAMNFSGQSASVTAPAAGLDLDQHGLTGSWYDAATNGQGIEVEVYPDLSPGAGLAQVSWFTFDIAAGMADHQRWYTLGGPVTSGQPNAALTIYQNTGGNFNAVPTTMAQAVGTATLSFATCTTGQLAYTFSDGSGRSGTIPLTRLTQNVTCATTTPPFSTNTDFAHSGNWYDAATAGQGFTVEVNPTSSTLFAAWYTYEPMGAAAGAAGQRWYTAQGSFTAGMRSIPVTLYATTGGIFNAPTPPAQTVAVGTGTLAFQSCTAATFNYHFTSGSSSGLSGTITLSRVGPVPPGCTS